MDYSNFDISKFRGIGKLIYDGLKQNPNVVGQVRNLIYILEKNIALKLFLILISEKYCPLREFQVILQFLKITRTLNKERKIMLRKLETICCGLNIANQDKSFSLIINRYRSMPIQGKNTALKPCWTKAFAVPYGFKNKESKRET